MANENDTKEYKRILLDTFKYTVEFLEKNNLRWFAAYGTLIGVVRHKGFIPWDDDIDIVMPRSDYNKLIELFDNDNSDYYFITRENRNYPFTFGKICHKHSTIVETKTIPCTLGIYVDVFPLDDFDKDFDELVKLKQEYLENHTLFEISKNRYSYRYGWTCLKNIRLWNFKEMLKNIFIYRPKTNFYLRNLLRLEQQATPNKGRFCACLNGYYKSKEIYERKWFQDYLMMDFEDIKVRVPIGYHDYLQHLYGDYMQFPPIDKRVAKHSHVYENLKMGMNISEARKYFEHGLEKKSN